jgi:hypothetical protein
MAPGARRQDEGEPGPSSGAAAAAAAARAAGAAAADESPPPPARLHPLTLRISPRELEARFWRDVGTPAYTASDRYGLAFTSLNTAAIWWVRARGGAAARGRARGGRARPARNPAGRAPPRACAHAAAPPRRRRRAEPRGPPRAPRLHAGGAC